MAEGDEEKKSSGDGKEAKTSPPVIQEAELSEEDRQLQDDLLMLVERLQESQTELHGPTLESLRNLIRSSTSSMTSVPKPLKFLRPHYDKIKDLHEAWKDVELKKRLADIISVLAMTQPEGRDCLEFRVKGSADALESWGHEYVRHISAQIGQAYVESKDEDLGDLSSLVDDIIPFNMKHNAEAEACDLLMELERIDVIRSFVDKNTYERVCLYLVSCVRYVPSPEDEDLLDTCMKMYTEFGQYSQALRMAMMKSNRSLAELSAVSVFTSCTDQLAQKQLAFIAGRQQFLLDLDEQFEDYEALTDIMSNSHLSTHFLMLARELDILEPKTPEDIYKTHLESHRPSFGASNIDSARQNLASSFVNGFVNCAYCKDKLMTLDGNKWIYKNKDSGMLSATASLGLILLWDVDGGLSSIDKYLYSNNDHIKAGALLACGIVNSGVRNDCDPALALLSDYVSSEIPSMRIASILGLGLAYAGTNADYVVDALSSPMTDPNASLEVVGITALALGLVTVGCCHSEVTLSVLQAMMDLDPKVIVKEKNARMLAISLALSTLGRQDAADAYLETLKTLPSSFCSFASVLVEACSKAGTGDVLAVQNLLHICGESLSDTSSQKKEEEKPESKDAAASSEPTAPATGPGLAPGITVTDGPAEADDSKSKKKDGKKGEKDDKKKSTGGAHQGAAVIGIALIAMGEEIGQEMALRSFSHLLHYGEPVIRRAVPLGLALLSVSDPKLKVLDTLSKLSHDIDQDVALSAILALGIVGAGTNNARLAAMLRQLAQYYYKDDNCLFMTRIAQGLTHLGKGTLTLSPYHCDKSILSGAGLSGLLALLIMCLDMKGTLLGNRHYFLYLLSTAIQPRMLVTLDEDLNNMPVSVRVGQAVDVVGQAGKPKTITGFQTHTTPVLLQAGERAELATDQYDSVSPLLEGFVILKKAEDAEED